jgi:primase-polymerase (primpol)-like protein
LIPAKLKEYSQWVLWKLEPQTKGKQKKIPYTTSGSQAKTNDPTTWTSFDEAFKTYQTNKNLYSGLGFVFTETDHFICIDYDDVIDSLGIIDPDISEEMAILNSYSEISQSGTGVHVIVAGDMPGSRKRGNGREMYGSGQFIAITGNHLKLTPITVNKGLEDCL